jgi:hypothetical protein
MPKMDPIYLAVIGRYTALDMFSANCRSQVLVVSVKPFCPNYLNFQIISDLP